MSAEFIYIEIFLDQWVSHLAQKRAKVDDSFGAVIEPEMNAGAAWMLRFNDLDHFRVGSGEFGDSDVVDVLSIAPAKSMNGTSMK